MPRCAVPSRSNKQVVVMVKTTDTHPPWFLVGVFLTCMCGLMVQVIVTRVLSVLANYSLAMIAIGFTGWIWVVGAVGAVVAGVFSIAGRIDGVRTQAAEPKGTPIFLIRPGLALGVLVLAARVKALLGTGGLRRTVLKGRIER